MLGRLPGINRAAENSSLVSCHGASPAWRPMSGLEPIGNIPPAEAEERYYAMLEQPAMAA
jgi:hypothetical protein